MKETITDVITKTGLGTFVLAVVILPAIGLIWLLFNYPLVFAVVVILIVGYTIGNELF